MYEIAVQGSDIKASKYVDKVLIEGINEPFTLRPILIVATGGSPGPGPGPEPYEDFTFIKKFGSDGSSGSLSNYSYSYNVSETGKYLIILSNQAWAVAGTSDLNTVLTFSTEPMETYFDTKFSYSGNTNCTRVIAAKLEVGTVLQYSARVQKNATFLVYKYTGFTYDFENRIQYSSGNDVAVPSGSIVCWNPQDEYRGWMFFAIETSVFSTGVQINNSGTFESIFEDYIALKHEGYNNGLKYKTKVVRDMETDMNVYLSASTSGDGWFNCFACPINFYHGDDPEFSGNYIKQFEFENVIASKNTITVSLEE